jgi:anti-anti-sigma factor
VPDPSVDLQHSGSDLETSPLSSWTGLRIAGEVDISNHDQFRRALAPVFASGIIAVHLDVSGLRFIDVAGTRELIALMKSHPHLRLIVHRPPASLRRIVALLWPNVGIEIRIDNPVGGFTRRRLPTLRSHGSRSRGRSTAVAR